MDRDVTHAGQSRATQRKDKRKIVEAHDALSDEVLLHSEKVRHENIGRLFLLGSRVFERMLVSEWRELGFADLRLIHLALVRSLPVGGLRTTEIAKSAGMTKQAVGQLAMELEKLGYVVRLPDPTDGRAKLVRYAPRGLEMAALIPRVILRAEAKVEKVIGSKDFIILRRSLKRLFATANSED